MLNVCVWTAQVLIFIAFGWIGILKLFLSIESLAAMWPWTGELPAIVVRLIGAIDIAGAVGVILPALTRIKPNLTMHAALGCIALQLCAMCFHLARGEFSGLPVNVVFLALASFVFWGRRRLPILPR